jgi:hypothetical protein
LLTETIDDIEEELDVNEADEYVQIMEKMLVRESLKLKPEE